MDDGKKSLMEIFTINRFYKIPTYQRSYTWEEEQLNDFYEDFKNEYPRCNYYYGTVLLQKEDTENHYEIVDGQQRITTLIIFIYCLLKEIKKRYEKSEYKDILDEEDINDLERMFIRFKGNNKLTLQQEENIFFDRYIINDEDYSEIETPAQKRLKRAKDKFKNLLESASHKDMKNFFANINRAKALVYIINDTSEASLIFETTNDRGKSLTNLEKIKSYLMYKVSSTKKEPKQLLDKIKDSFNKIYRDYEKIEDRQIGEDSILMYNFIANEQWDNKGGKKKYQHYIDELKSQIENLIKKENTLVKNKEEKEDYKELRKYIERYLINLNNSYEDMSNILLKPTNEFNDMLSLGKIAPLYPLLLKAYNMDTTEKKQLFKKLCRMCEIFIFRNWVILNYRPSKYQTKFYELARNFGNSKRKIDIQFEDLYKKIAQYTISLGDDEKFISELKNNDFYNRYKTNERNYFYWKYENWLRSKDGCNYTLLSYQDLNNKDPKLRLTIEHIVAQSNEEQKENIIKETKIINIKDKNEFDKKYLNSIGNLTIDPSSSNSSKGKKPVEGKMSKYFMKAPYMSQNELEKFLDNEKWTINSIENREETILKFAKENWCKPLKEFKITEKDIQQLMKDNNFDELDEME